MDYAYGKPRTEETQHSYLVAAVNVKNVDLTIKLTYNNQDIVQLTTLYKAPGKKRSVKLKERNINIADIDLAKFVKQILDEDMHTIDNKLKLNVISYIHVNIQFNN